MHTAVMGYTATRPISRTIFIAHALYRIQKHHSDVKAFATDDGLLCVRTEQFTDNRDDDRIDVMATFNYMYGDYIDNEALATWLAN